MQIENMDRSALETQERFLRAQVEPMQQELCPIVHLLNYGLYKKGQP